jgi:hypothetical protein
MNVNVHDSYAFVCVNCQRPSRAWVKAEMNAAEVARRVKAVQEERKP